MTDLADLPIGEAIDAAEFTRRMHQLVPLTGEIGVVATEMPSAQNASFQG